MSGKYIFLGDFKGSFYTLQDSVLGSAEKRPVDNKHAVRVFRGVLQNAMPDTGFNPEKYTKLNSFLLVNVSRIEIQPATTEPFSEKRVYNFTQLLLIEPKVNSTYLHNGKTYGEIESKAYGITEDYPINQLDGEENTQPYPVDENYEVTDNNDAGSDKSSTEDEDNTGTGGTTPGGCGALLRGCLTNIWRILFYLILILLVLWMFKSCNSDDECALKDIAKYKLEKAKKHLDSTKIAYEKNLEEALADISTVYFYQNSAEIHLNSSGDNSPISKLAILMNAYADKQFFIEGYHSGVDVENAKDIDLIRAEVLKGALLEKGVRESNLDIVAMGDKNKKDPSGKLSKFFISANNYRYYNRNMRAEVKIKKAP
jgi:outer membrane protein OmpA-like peptidoglycan-associated protein